MKDQRPYRATGAELRAIDQAMWQKKPAPIRLIRAALERFNLAALRRGDAFIWFRGTVVYRDVFSPTGRETAFCYRYTGIEGQPRSFARFGGEDYNYRN